MEYLHGLVRAAILLFLMDDQVDVNIGMYKVAIRAPLHGSLDPHQAVLLQSTEGYYILTNTIYVTESTKILSNIPFTVQHGSCSFMYWETRV